MWRTPVDTGEEVAELCRTDGHDTVPVLPLAKHVIGSFQRLDEILPSSG
jgi:hypothetical protein